MMKKICSLIFSVLAFVSFARAQKAEVTIQLNEPFFDALLDAVFKNSNPSFPLAGNDSRFRIQDSRFKIQKSGFKIQDSRFQIQESNNFNLKSGILNSESEIINSCDESIKLQREIDGVRTAVRFVNGKIYAPLAFSGNYNPPLVGCVEFSGWAESYIELSFDKDKQALIGRAQIANVQLSGTNGIGSSLVTKLVQSSIDKKMNPIQILPLEKISFTVPIQNSGNVRMKAVEIRPEIVGSVLNVHLTYEFSNN